MRPNPLDAKRLAGFNDGQGKTEAANSGSPWGVPDYLTDLNAMHEAEKVLIESKQVTAYVTFLCHLCERAKPMQMIWHATSAQRAEAFLRCIRKWGDDK